jgi:hypothetical protein
MRWLRRLRFWAADNGPWSQGAAAGRSWMAAEPIVIRISKDPPLDDGYAGLLLVREIHQLTRAVERLIDERAPSGDTGRAVALARHAYQISSDFPHRLPHLAACLGCALVRHDRATKDSSALIETADVVVPACSAVKPYDSAVSDLRRLLLVLHSALTTRFDTDRESGLLDAALRTDLALLHLDAQQERAAEESLAMLHDVLARVEVHGLQTLSHYQDAVSAAAWGRIRETFGTALSKIDEASATGEARLLDEAERLIEETAAETTPFPRLETLRTIMRMRISLGRWTISRKEHDLDREAHNLDRAIAIGTTTAAGWPEDKPAGAVEVYRMLALALGARYERTGSADDLDQVVDCCRSALDVAGENGPVEDFQQLLRHALEQRRDGEGVWLEEWWSTMRRDVSRVSTAGPDAQFTMLDLGETDREGMDVRLAGDTRESGLAWRDTLG